MALTQQQHAAAAASVQPQVDMPGVLAALRTLTRVQGRTAYVAAGAGAAAAAGVLEVALVIRTHVMGCRLP